MKKITQKLVILSVLLLGFQSSFATAISAYCQTTVKHLNVAAETASAIKLTISKIDATSIYVEIESANTDPVDLLLVNGTTATVSAPDVSVAGKIKTTLTWTTAPTDVSMELVWSKVSMAGNWMLNAFTVPFDASCTGGISDTTLPIMVSASLVGSPTFNSANLLVSATDNLTSPVTSYVANDAVNGISNKVITADATGNVTVTGLKGSTSYNLVITAKDAAGNVSANSKSVSFTTTVAPTLSTINFETVGQDWSWTVFSNGPGGSDVPGNITAPIANPSATGINTSASCAKLIDDATAAPWGGMWSDNLVDFTFSASNCIVKVMVYKSVISNFDVKFEGASGLNFEKLVPNTKINQWEELSFDFSNKIGSTVSRLVIIPDFPSARSAGSTNYFDNVSFSDGTTAVKSVSADVDAISCYPNPTNNQITISSKSEISQVILRNLLGQSVRVETVNSHEKYIDLSDVSSGNYLVTVKLANGQLSTQKLVKL
ncbi:MAG: T9SS type A sorting domain-containing protein [Paludibacter sp.]